MFASAAIIPTRSTELPLSVVGEVGGVVIVVTIALELLLSSGAAAS